MVHLSSNHSKQSSSSVDHFAQFNKCIMEHSNKPFHPGEILKTLLKEPRQYQRALHIFQEMKFDIYLLNRIMDEREDVTPAIAIGLSKINPQQAPEFWCLIQMHYDLWNLMHDKEFTQRLEPKEEIGV